jgi:ATP-dependent RNA helicase RhlE
MSFSAIGLRQPILDALTTLGYKKPSPIQTKVIPPILADKDVLAAAQTGTGKTAGFALPMLEKLADGKRAGYNECRALILAPTRELAAQIGESIQQYGQNIALSSFVVFGGVKINPQMMRLRRGVDILVATPGRLLDLAQNNAIKFHKLEILVLDEADRMLDMGFIHDIRKILQRLPNQRQNLMFSATFSAEIKKLAQSIVRNPEIISASPSNTTAQRVQQWLHPVDKSRKQALLTHLIRDKGWDQVLVFTRTKYGANRLSKHLAEQGISSAAIHGNKSQSARTRALASFKAGEVRTLVATDIAARGLDIEQLPQVVNFDLPSVAEDYVHRIGRTGRAGASGHAISLVCADEVQQLKSIEQFINTTLERHYVGGFEPKHEVPNTALKDHAKKRPSPKKARSHSQGSPSSTKPRTNATKKTTTKTAAKRPDGRNTKRRRTPRKLSAAKQKTI